MKTKKELFGILPLPLNPVILVAVLCALCASVAMSVGCARPRYFYSFTTNVTTEQGLNVTESYGIGYSSKPDNWPAIAGP